MDIRIGIINTPREITFESSQTAPEVEQLVTAAIESGAPFIKLADSKGKLFLLPTASLAYIEIGTESARRVGFVA